MLTVSLGTVPPCQAVVSIILQSSNHELYEAHLPNILVCRKYSDLVASNLQATCRQLKHDCVSQERCAKNGVCYANQVHGEIGLREFGQGGGRGLYMAVFKRFDNPFDNPEFLTISTSEIAVKQDRNKR